MTRPDEPRWLTPEQTQAWIGLLRTTVSLPAALDAQLRRDAGLSHAEYQVLSWCSMSPGRAARMGDIAVRANVSLSHLSRIAARLESRGWLTRVPDPTDGRATLATLTEDGWEKVVATAPGHAEEVQRLVFDNLDAEQVRQLREITERIVDATQRERALPPPPGAVAR
ncbi:MULTISPECIES: MarR family winged helix-turn-helix transcriptional regulator [unclassified Actinotalea]|uniref:MarR family winged helix-turn-helix transcriptional regulator n=1 Tax=unclassified Actinotalea TaxID=2638618 RepID=UPI0015F64DB5|nr:MULTISPECIES: MarR family winged helix-turn-helix transcriptional regulator [unclassified Actinotalea]